MKCKNCGVEWPFPVSSDLKPKYCPMCGTADFLEHPQKAETIEDAIFLIAKNQGMEILKSGDQTVAHFAEVAPHLKKEKTLLQYLVQCEGNQTLVDALDKDSEEQQLAMSRVEKLLADELFISEEAIKKVCTAFWNAAVKAKGGEKDAGVFSQGEEPVKMGKMSAETPEDYPEKRAAKAESGEKPTMTSERLPAGFLFVNGMYEDNMLTCKDCGLEFVFSAGEQEYYATHGFDVAPRMCKACRNAARAKLQNRTVICQGCGKKLTSRPIPTPSRAFYCSDCFKKRGGGIGLGK